MAGILTISPGHDASYPWRQIGTTQASDDASPLGYYLTPAAKGGEPPGRWTGRGAQRPGGGRVLGTGRSRGVGVHRHRQPGGAGVPAG